MVAIPLAPTIERHQEHVRGLQAAQLLPARPAAGKQGVAQRGTQLIEHRRAPQELLHSGGRSSPPRGRGSRSRTGPHPRPSTPPHRLERSPQRGQPAGQPSVRSVTAAASSGVRVDLGLCEDLLGASRIQGQVAQDELVRVPAARSRGRWVARNDWPRPIASPGNARDHQAEHVVAGRAVQFVKVVQHQHERHRDSPSGAAAKRGAARPNTEIPDPSCRRPGRLPGAIRAKAEASKVSRTPGSSSKRSSDTHATRRSSTAAHWRQSVDLPYPPAR